LTDQPIKKATTEAPQVVGDRILEDSQAEPYWSSFRLELKGWLKRNAPALEELYDGALQMLYSPRFPGKARFVAHAVREIANRLPETITGIKGQRFEWQNKLDGVLVSWERAGLSLDGSMLEPISGRDSAPSTDVLVPRKVVQDIVEVLSEYAAGRETNREKARRLFEGVDPKNQAARESFTPIVTQWLSVTDWFMKIVHVPVNTDAAVDASELQRQFELFEITLGALTREFFKTIGELDAILEKANA
jgi:hypothetical protein